MTDDLAHVHIENDNVIQPQKSQMEKTIDNWMQ